MLTPMGFVPQYNLQGELTSPKYDWRILKLTPMVRKGVNGVQ